MAVQTTSNLDQRLAQLYSETVTVNLEQESKISPDDFWNSMQVVALNNKAILNI